MTRQKQQEVGSPEDFYRFCCCSAQDACLLYSIILGVSYVCCMAGASYNGQNVRMVTGGLAFSLIPCALVVIGFFAKKPALYMAALVFNVRLGILVDLFQLAILIAVGVVYNKSDPEFQRLLGKGSYIFVALLMVVVIQIIHIFILLGYEIAICGGYKQLKVENMVLPVTNAPSRRYTARAQNRSRASSDETRSV
uniref:Uncharacterized protein n=1 Tax=Ditylenchus dipsaci TaxID=166011 RepID=A0A915DW87_9BILA